MTKRKNRIRVIFLLLLGIYVNPILAFEPAEYVSEKENNFLFFTETNTLEKIIKNFKSFYFSLRRGQKNKELEWRFLTQLISPKVGFNLFDPRQLSKIGVNTRSKLGVIIYDSNAPSLLKKPIQIFIPTSNSKKFYNALKRIFLKNSKKRRKSNSFKEIKKGKLFHRRSGVNHLYLARGEKHIVLSNHRRFAESGITKRKSSFKGSKKYKIFKKNFLPKRGSLARFILSKKIFSSLQPLRKTLFFRTNSANAKRILGHTAIIGGQFIADSSQINLSMKHLFQKGFLKDKKMINLQFDFIKKMKENDKVLPMGSLNLDHNQSSKALHMSNLFNVDHVWNQLKGLSFLNPINILPGQNNILAIKKILKPHLKGNMSMVIFEPSRGSFSLNLIDTDFIASMGIKKAKMKVLQRSLKKYLKTSFKRDQLSLKEKRHRSSDLWEVQWMKSDRGRRIPQKMYILFQKESFTFLSQKNSLKRFFDETGGDIIKENQNILSANTRETSGIILLDMENIYSFLNKSGLGRLFPQYVNYLKNMEKAVIHSFQKKDSVSSEFKLLLK